MGSCYLDSETGYESEENGVQCVCVCVCECVCLCVCPEELP